MTWQETTMTAVAAQFEQAPAHSEQPRSIRTCPAGWLAWWHGRSTAVRAP
jgi:hypothetical protein